jgi:hypothetical protein
MIIVINVVGYKFFCTNTSQATMKIDTFAFEEAKPGFDGDIVCTATLSGDAMKD